jgi:hypothetical protein
MQNKAADKARFRRESCDIRHTILSILQLFFRLGFILPLRLSLDLGASK